MFYKIFGEASYFIFVIHHTCQSLKCVFFVGMQDNQVLANTASMIMPKSSFITTKQLWEIVLQGKVEATEFIPVDVSDSTQTVDRSNKISPITSQLTIEPNKSQTIVKKNPDNLIFVAVNQNVQLQLSILKQQQNRVAAMESALQRIHLEITAMSEQLILQKYQKNRFFFMSSINALIRISRNCIKVSVQSILLEVLILTN